MWLLAPLVATPLLCMLLLHPQHPDATLPRLKLSQEPAKEPAPPLEEPAPPRAESSRRAASATRAAAAQLPSPSPPPPPDDTGFCHGRFEVMPGVDLPQGDLDTAPAPAESLSQCCQLCAEDPSGNCRAVTYTPLHECWLKGSDREQPSVQRGLVSAVMLPGGGGGGGGGGEVAMVEGRAAPTTAAAGAGGGGSVAPVARAAPGSGGECSRDPAVGCMANPAVVVMTHNRDDLLRRCLDQLGSMRLIERFTLYVSEDSGSEAALATTRRVAASAGGGRVAEVLSSVPKAGGHPFARTGLHKIAEHFKHALEATLGKRGHSHAVLVEDDLLLSPDALLLFWSTAWLLREDPTLWCVSAWHDQGFPHTVADPRTLTRTDYFPGLGWMIEASTWHEIRGRWPERPTTGWDHWFRLSTTSRGRECVVPHINRSRHANKKGTNVLDNKPFERFIFESKGVGDEGFGDLSYLRLHDAFEARLAAQARGAARVSLPAPLDGKRQPSQGSAMRWMEKLPAGGASLLLYVREEYQSVAKPLGIWGESPRATHNGTIALPLPGGHTLLLADRRRCPYLLAEERWRPPAGSRDVAAAAGKSCAETCAESGGSCRERELEWANTCAAMQAAFPCEAGCGHQVGPELPAYGNSPSLDTHKQCLITDIAISKCDAKFAKTRRLCRCVFDRPAKGSV